MNSDCSFIGDREDVLIGYVYGEIDPAERAVFEAHLPSCAACRQEIAELRTVRTELARWTPPAFERLMHPPADVARTRWWQEVPFWAQTAAAMLFLGAAAGMANLNIKYDRNGLNVRTGWLPAASASAASDSRQAESAAPPWRADLAALERQMRTEFQASTAIASASRTEPDSKSADSGDDLKRVRALVADSERRQQRELALRIAEVLHDVQSERQADLVRIERSLGTIQNNTGVEVMRQRQLLNSLAVRVSQRQ
jgi:hypothetical protein